MKKKIKKPLWVRLWVRRLVDIIDPLEEVEDLEQQEQFYAEVGKAFCDTLILYEFDSDKSKAEPYLHKLHDRTANKTRKAMFEMLTETFEEYQSKVDFGKEGAKVRWGTSSTSDTSNTSNTSDIKKADKKQYTFDDIMGGVVDLSFLWDILELPNSFEPPTDNTITDKKGNVYNLTELVNHYFENPQNCNPKVARIKIGNL